MSRAHLPSLVFTGAATERPVAEMLVNRVLAHIDFVHLLDRGRLACPGIPWSDALLATTDYQLRLRGTIDNFLTFGEQRILLYFANLNVHAGYCKELSNQSLCKMQRDAVLRFNHYTGGLCNTR